MPNKHAGIVRKWREYLEDWIPVFSIDTAKDLHESMDLAIEKFCKEEGYLKKTRNELYDIVEIRNSFFKQCEDLSTNYFLKERRDLNPEVIEEGSEE